MTAADTTLDPTALGSIPRTGWFNLAWSLSMGIFLWALEWTAPPAQPALGLTVLLAYTVCLGYWVWTLVGMVYLAKARRVWAEQPEARASYAEHGVYGLLNWRTHLLCAVVCVPLACAFGSVTAEALVGWVPWPWDTPVHRPGLGLALIMGYTLALLTFTLDYMRVRMAVHEVRAESAQRQAIATQLRLLQAQLDPHMMFNTLANLHALIDADPPRAQRMLSHLITFLRATLAGSRNMLHPLRDEFARLQDYLALMQIRMGDRLTVELKLDAVLGTVPVPTLLLQPLVENAIKHGIESSRAGGELRVMASAQGNDLVVSIVNTGSPLPEEAGTPSEAGGFGLQGVRERLHTAYGDRASLLIQSQPPYTRVTVRLPLAAAPSALERPAPRNDTSPFAPSRFRS